MPWYQDYFTADFWSYADAEYSQERTRAEVGYLAEVIERHAPGRRVLDLGCGTGRHAIGLARLGFEVTGVDFAAPTLERAALAAAKAGVEVTFQRADLLADPDWGVAAADAAICVQSFGWGTDFDQLRILRQVRDLLGPRGLLVLDHSSILAITRSFQPRAQATISAGTFTFTRHYDPVTGRSAGEILVERSDGSKAVLPDDIRMYSPVEVGALLDRAGYDVLGSDADFLAGRPVTIETRYVQFLARPARRVESALTGHQGQAGPADVDLRWAPDEADLTASAVAAAWAKVAADPGALPDLARRYDVTDPYGGARAAGILAAHLGWQPAATLSADRVSVGAGVTGLLHNLARLADGGTVLIAPDGHPQLAEAASAAGIGVVVRPLPDLETASAAVAQAGPAVVVLDRPAMTGPRWPARDVAELATSTARAGGVLVVDESYACYLPPGDSVARLTETVRRLIVLRGVSKGFCCGGLRIGFAICSPDLAGAARSVLAPLAGSALALDVALDLLARPDQLAALRARIAEIKPRLQAAVARAGITVLPTDVHVPWLALRADEPTTTFLAQRHLVVKDAGPHLLRMSVPLSAGRVEATMTALAR